MTKNLTILACCIVVVLAVIMFRSTKSPAAEDRVKMDQMAKHLSDSIHAALDSSLNDPIREMGGTLPSSKLPPPQPVQPVSASATVAPNPK